MNEFKTMKMDSFKLNVWKLHIGLRNFFNVYQNPLAFASVCFLSETDFSAEFRIRGQNEEELEELFPVLLELNYG